MTLEMLMILLLQGTLGQLILLTFLLLKTILVLEICKGFKDIYT